MDNLLLELSKAVSKIKHDGRLSIPPSFDKHLLTVRIEWYKNEKYGIERRFSISNLKCPLNRSNSLDEFIEYANREIQYYMDKEAHENDKLISKIDDE